ncbi:MAG: caspase family protein [Planktothrix sp.]
MSKSNHQSKYEFHRNIAIIIGINEYKNDIPRLETAVPDAEEFARIMQEQYQYEIHLLLNEDATLEKLKQLINCFHNKKIPFGQDPEITEKDRILIYFAGHGKALDAKENQEGPVGYLIPQDATDNPNTYLKMQDFHDALLKLPCRHLLVILDCCFSGAFYWSSINRDIVPKLKIYKQVYDHYLKYRAWQVITSTSDKQTAIDFSPRGQVLVNSKVHSPFATHLFDALNKGADLDQDGIITANDLFNFVRKAVAIETEEYKAQTPGICPLKLHENGEYLFLLQNQPTLEDAPLLNLDPSPYRGLKSYEEEHKDLYFGRSAQIETLFKTVNNLDKRALTVVLGASGTGKSSLVKAGLIPFLNNKKDPKDPNIQPDPILQNWKILKPVRLGEFPLTELKKYFAEELNFTIPSSTSTQFQTNKPNLFRGILNFLGFGIQPNNSQQNQKLEKEVEWLSQTLDNWFKENSDSTLLITIDQFEELITLQPRQEQNKKKKVTENTKTQQELVLKWLAQVMSKYGDRLRIILTLRSDFESQFKDGALKEHWKEKARFHIKEMTTAELREAITEPASKASIFFVPNTLIDKLVDEVAGMPGTLPLLSFTLNELYCLFVEAINNGVRDDRAITEKDYTDLGGVTQALTKKAEQEYGKLVNKDKSYEQTIRRVMLRMVAVGGGELARRRVLKESELKYPEPENLRVQEVLHNFVNARLLVEGENAEKKSYVEPAHDALVRGWDRLLKWQQEEEENLILQRLLTPAAVEWKLERSQSNGYLWHNNPRLDLLKKELKSKDNWFNELETEFVTCSIKHKSFWAKVAIIVTSGVILALLGGLIFSLRGQRNALIGQIRSSQQASEANFISNQELDALMNSLQAAKILKDWPWYLFWVKPGNQITYLFEADKAIELQVVKTLRNVSYSAKESNRWDVPSGWVESIFLNSEHQLFIVTREKDEKEDDENKKHTLRLWNKDKEVTELPWQKDRFLAVSPDGNELATATPDGIVRLWDLQGNKLKEFVAHKCQKKEWGFCIEDASFSPDGSTIVTVGDDKFVRSWSLKETSVTTVTKIREVSLPQNVVHVVGIGFKPDDETGLQDELLLATLVENNLEFRVKVINLSGKQLALSGDIQTTVVRAEFSPNGQQVGIEYGEESDNGMLLNLGLNNNVDYSPIGIGDRVKNFYFDNNGKPVYVGIDGTVNYVDYGGPQKIFGLPNGVVNKLIFTRDGKQLFTVGDDNTIRLWDLEQQPLSKFPLSQQEIESISFSPDGKTIATGDSNGIMRLLDLKGNVVKEFQALPKVTSVSFSPDGQTIATTGDEGVVRLLDLQGNVVKEFQADPSEKVKSVSWSQDGQRIATIGYECILSPEGCEVGQHSARLWDTQGNPLEGEPNHLISDYLPFESIGFQTNNKPILITIGQDDRWTFNVDKLDFSGRSTNIIPGRQQGNYFKFVKISYDGSLLLTAGENTIHFRDLMGKKLIEFSSDKPIKSVSLNSDNSMLAVIADDGTAELWKLGGFDELFAKACNRVRDYLQNNPHVSESDRKLCDGVPLDTNIGDKISRGDKILVPVQTPTHPDK